MSTPGTAAPVTMAASVLCRALLAGPRTPLTSAHRGRLAWLRTPPDPAGWVCLATPRAVLLPRALLVTRLPAVASAVSVGDGCLWYDDQPVAVRRWFTPPRVTRGCLAGRPKTQERRLDHWLANWASHLGSGQGLTPYGDDVLCGAMLALRATDHPRGDWLAAQLRDTDLESRTTAVSAGLLRSAGAGWCIPEVAAVVAALSTGRDAVQAVRRLLAVGHSSGHGLWAGLSAVLDTPPALVAA